MCLLLRCIVFLRNYANFKLSKKTKEVNRKRKIILDWGIWESFLSLKSLGKDEREVEKDKMAGKRKKNTKQKN